MKSEFINNMTHEIKTPLATIGLACEMLRDETISQDSESRQNFIGIINDENQRMRVLVETILQSAKMSNKNFRINPKEVDVHQIIGKVATSFKLPIANRSGKLTTDLQADPSVVVADELHLTNLVYNLIDNGIKYSTDSPDITVSTRSVDGQLELRVSDHGIGISKADQKHVFEKFYRVSTGDVHNVKGFGIGLSYVAQVVKLHHGHIALESEPGQGSTFIVTLPL
jgi:two-component system phosphate regulon sensor histidine kinase PhoR